MNKSFTIEDKKIFIKKDCKICCNLKICKFHSKMRELCTSNEFYSMNEYLEWNNSLASFEEHSRCGFFKHNFEIPLDKIVTIKTDNYFLSEIVDLELIGKVKNLGARIDTVKDLVTVSTGFGAEFPPVEFKLSDLISGYTFN